MINPAWIFVIASAIAVFGILFAFKNLMTIVQSKLEERRDMTIEAFQKEQTSFFMKVAMAETIPILLIVYGFVQIEKFTGKTSSIFLPLIIIISVLLIAFVNVMLVRRDTLGYDSVSKETKNMVNTLIFIGLSLIMAIPIVSIIAILTMI